MTAGITAWLKVQPSEAEAADHAMADLRTAEALVASALVSAETAQWGEQMRGDIGRVLGNLRHLLGQLA